MEKIRCIAIFGPTASGKTALAVSLAEKYGGEIVSADSMQIYKEMQIGTAKPAEKELRGIPCHLTGFLPPEERFSVADFVKCANEVIEGIVSRGRLPVIAGGTGLYLRALLENLDFSKEERNDALREELNREAEEKGGETLLRRLAGFDPAYASTLHPNNIKRIIRAIELYETTGVTMSEQLLRSRENPGRLLPCKMAILFGDRQKLYDRIDRRVDAMMAEGLSEEARRFYEAAPGKTAAQAIGYKELFPFFEGEISLEEAVENIKRETRRYAKRQLTWIRAEKDIFPLRADGPEELLPQACRIWENFLKGGSDLEGQSV